MEQFEGEQVPGEYAGWSRRQTGQRCRLAPTVFMAIFLIVAGILLFLANIGWLPIRHIWDYWPVLVIGLGLAKVLGARSVGERVWGVLVVFVAGVFLAGNLGLFHVRARDGSWPLSILFIAFGIGALSRALDGRGRRGRYSNEPVLPANTPEPDRDFLNDSAVFGSVQRRFETPNFEGGAVTSVLGSVEVDLRRAQISNPAGSATIEVVTVFGSVKLRIPETWRLGLIGTPVFGSYEDKTLLQARVEGPVPTLTITGSCVFGSVEIEN